MLPCCCLSFASIPSQQKSLEKTLYVITEGRITIHVPEYEHPYCGTCLDMLKWPKASKGVYFDMDQLHVTSNKGENGCCLPYTDPDRVPYLGVYYMITTRKRGKHKGTVHPFYASSEEERDAIMDLIRYYKLFNFINFQF